MLSLQTSELCSTTPHPQASAAPPFGSKGGHTRLRRKGWGNPIPTKGLTPRYFMHIILPLWF